MQLLILASIGLLFFGALATCLIAHFLPDEIMRNGTHHGRYAYLGEDEVKEIRSPTRRDRRRSLQGPIQVAIRIRPRSQWREIRRQTASRRHGVERVITS